MASPTFAGEMPPARKTGSWLASTNSALIVQSRCRSVRRVADLRPAPAAAAAPSALDGPRPGAARADRLRWLVSPSARTRSVDLDRGPSAPLTANYTYSRNARRLSDPAGEFGHQ